jgi:hypothetical protein
VRLQPAAAAALALVVAGCGGAPARVARRPCLRDGRLGTQASLGGKPVPGFLNPTLFHLTNMWLVKRNGVYIDVYAGAPVAAPRRGVLVVEWTDPRVGLPDDRRSGEFAVGKDTGPLSLTGVCGNLLSFRYRRGVGVFDLATRRFRLAPLRRRP